MTTTQYGGKILISENGSPSMQNPPASSSLKESSDQSDQEGEEEFEEKEDAFVCPICQGDAAETASYARLQDCKHLFCEPCITEWSKNANTCPICRTRFEYLFTCSHLDGDFSNKIAIEYRCMKDESSVDHYTCRICNSGDQEELLLLCDGCDQAYHTFCISLSAIPDGDWFCEQCTGHEADEEEEMGLEINPAAGSVQLRPSTRRVAMEEVVRRTRRAARTNSTSRSRAISQAAQLISSITGRARTAKGAKLARIATRTVGLHTLRGLRQQNRKRKNVSRRITRDWSPEPTSPERLQAWNNRDKQRESGEIAGFSRAALSAHKAHNTESVLGSHRFFEEPPDAGSSAPPPSKSPTPANLIDIITSDIINSSMRTATVDKQGAVLYKDKEQILKEEHMIPLPKARDAEEEVRMSRVRIKTRSTSGDCTKTTKSRTKSRETAEASSSRTENRDGKSGERKKETSSEKPARSEKKSETKRNGEKDEEVKGKQGKSSDLLPKAKTKESDQLKGKEKTDKTSGKEKKNRKVETKKKVKKGKFIEDDIQSASDMRSDASGDEAASDGSSVCKMKSGHASDEIVSDDEGSKKRSNRHAKHRSDKRRKRSTSSTGRDKSDKSEKSRGKVKNDGEVKERKEQKKEKKRNSDSGTPKRKSKKSKKTKSQRRDSESDIEVKHEKRREKYSSPKKKRPRSAPREHSTCKSHSRSPSVKKVKDSAAEERKSPRSSRRGDSRSRESRSKESRRRSSPLVQDEFGRDLSLRGAVAAVKESTPNTTTDDKSQLETLKISLTPADIPEPRNSGNPSELTEGEKTAAAADVYSPGNESPIDDVWPTKRKLSTSEAPPAPLSVVPPVVSRSNSADSEDMVIDDGQSAKSAASSKEEIIVESCDTPPQPLPSTKPPSGIPVVSSPMIDTVAHLVTQMRQADKRSDSPSPKTPDFLAAAGETSSIPSPVASEIPSPEYCMTPTDVQAARRRERLRKSGELERKHTQRRSSRGREGEEESSARRRKRSSTARRDSGGQRKRHEVRKERSSGREHSSRKRKSGSRERSRKKSFENDNKPESPPKTAAIPLLESPPPPPPPPRDEVIIQDLQGATPTPPSVKRESAGPLVYVNHTAERKRARLDPPSSQTVTDIMSSHVMGCLNDSYAMEQFNNAWDKEVESPTTLVVKNHGKTEVQTKTIAPVSQPHIKHQLPVMPPHRDCPVDPRSKNSSVNRNHLEEIMETIGKEMLDNFGQDDDMDIEEDEVPPPPPTNGSESKNVADNPVRESKEKKVSTRPAVKKSDVQHEIANVVKLALKVPYKKKKITKDDYKNIMKQVVSKVYESRHVKRGDPLRSDKITEMVAVYIKQSRQKRKVDTKTDTTATTTTTTTTAATDSDNWAADIPEVPVFAPL